MNVYKLIGLLLTYPEAEWTQAVDEIRFAMNTDLQHHAIAHILEPLITYLSQHALLDLQERYVATFDQTPGQSLYFLEHTIGDGPDRGQALVALIEQYRKHGLETTSVELPDFLPMYLEFLSLLSPCQAQEELTTIHSVMETLAGRLRQAHSPYAAAFEALMVVRSRPGLHRHIPTQAIRWVRDRWSF
jgi:nitrate reductase delta subunit